MTCNLHQALVDSQLLKPVTWCAFTVIEDQSQLLSQFNSTSCHCCTNINDYYSNIYLIDDVDVASGWPEKDKRKPIDMWLYFNAFYLVVWFSVHELLFLFFTDVLQLPMTVLTVLIIVDGKGEKVWSLAKNADIIN